MIQSIPNILSFRKALFLSLLFATGGRPCSGAQRNLLFDDLFQDLFTVLAHPNQGAQNVGIVYATSEWGTYDYNTQILPYIRYLGLKERYEYNDMSQTVDSISKLALFKNDGLKKEYFDKLSEYGETNPEDLVDDADKAGITTSKIEGNDWTEVQNSIVSIREAINEIKNAKMFGTAYNKITKENSTYTAKFIVHVFLKKGVELDNLKKVVDTLKRVSDILRKRKSIDNKEAKDNKKRKQEQRDLIIKNKQELQLQEKRNKVGFDQNRIQEEHNQALLAQQQLEAREREQRLERERQDKLEADNENKAKERQKDIVKEQLKWDNVKQTVQQTVNLITSAHFIQRAVMLVAGVIFAYYFLKYTLKELITRFFKGVPKIFLYYHDPRAWSKGTKMPLKKGRPILNKEKQKVVDGIFNYFAKIVKMRENGHPRASRLEVRNYMLTGPGGVGKTMTVLALVNLLLGLSTKKVAVAFIPAPRILQLEPAEARKKMASIFDWAKRLKAKGILVFIIIDEADSLFAPRGKGQDALRGDLANILLTEISKPSDSHISCWLISNMKLDDALKTRFIPIEYTLPKGEVIDSVVDMYLKELSDRLDLSVDPAIAEPNHRREIRHILDRMPPRVIEEVVRKLSNELVMEGHNRITYAKFKEASEAMVSLQVESERQAEARYNGVPVSTAA